MILSEALENVFIKKTNKEEVADLLLRGHYLGDWPFVSSKYQNYIYGIYRTENGMPTLVGCIVYGLAEFHASSYVSKWIRQLLSPSESIEAIYQNIQSAIEKDKMEVEKAKQRGYQYQPKSKNILQNLLNVTNIQDNQILELKRLYILPELDEKNIESYSIQKGNDVIFKDNPDIQVIVSFSDSKVGHHGGIYQASNAMYAGMNKSKLHRYVYVRREIEKMIEKYKQDYKALVYNYPKKADGSPTSAIPMVKGDKNMNRVIKYLKNKVPSIQDMDLRGAIEKVVAYVQDSPKQTMTITEIREMIGVEYNSRKVLNETFQRHLKLMRESL